MDLDISPAFEERLIAHKVVTTPRGRLVGSDGSPRRPRSLSAPRTRQRATDLVQNLYDRMGVNYQRGQATDLNSPAPTMTERASAPQPFLSRPTTPVTVPGNSQTIFQRPAAGDDNNYGEITQSASFHERYRAVTSRGRASDRGLHAPMDDTASEGRARSLSRGRVSQRWPPSRHNTMEEAVPLAPTPAKPSYSPSRRGRPSWMESSAYNRESCNNSQTRSVEAEEKKEENGPDANVDTPVSLKDRISVFGTQKGSTPKASRIRSTRSVDPRYAAQFAVRDHPPKIDIYAHNSNKELAPSEATDMSTVTSPTLNEPMKSQQLQQQSQIPVPKSSKPYG